MPIHLQGNFKRMQRIHVLLRKEDILPNKMKEGKKIAVVLDILLATSTMVSALKNGSREVIPVLDAEEARQVYQAFSPATALIAGEYLTMPIKDFAYPNPSYINKRVNGRTLILATTNGTVALRKAAYAHVTYISSLLNNHTTAKTITENADNETVIIICSGNSGDFSLEDFYGAGHLIDCLIQASSEEPELNDAGKAALSFYRNHSGTPYELIATSQVGNLLLKNRMDEDLHLVSSKESIELAVIMEGHKAIAKKPC